MVMVTFTLLKAHHTRLFLDTFVDCWSYCTLLPAKMQTRKRRKSEDVECKKSCMSPSMFETPTVGRRGQQSVCDSSAYQQWDVDDVASFLSANGFKKYVSIFRGICSV